MRFFRKAFSITGPMNNFVDILFFSNYRSKVKIIIIDLSQTDLFWDEEIHYYCIHVKCDTYLIMSF